MRPMKTHSLRKTDEENQKALHPQYASLYQAIEEASQKGNCDSVSLLVSVQAELRRYNLEQFCPASTVLNTSFLRGIQAIDRGKQIPNPSAWIRLTCRHIIKEKSREKQKELRLETTEWLAEEVDEGTEVDSDQCDRHQKIRQAFQQLSQLDRDILTLKTVEALRWNIIQLRLMEMGYQKYSLPALRKRKSRALKELKALYDRNS